LSLTLRVASLSCVRMPSFSVTSVVLLPACFPLKPSLYRNRYQSTRCASSLEIDSFRGYRNRSQFVGGGRFTLDHSQLPGGCVDAPGRDGVRPLASIRSHRAS